MQPDVTRLKSFTFGDSPQMADRLAALVVAGVKTATCSAAAHGPDTHVGEHQVCLDGAGCPVCVLETLSLRTLPFASVTPDMAAMEGEGDLSYRYWREAHIAFFQREGSWSPDMDVIFETFRVVEILQAAFAALATWLEDGCPPQGQWVVPARVVGSKCARCWQVYPTVDADGLCERCADAVAAVAA